MALQTCRPFPLWAPLVRAPKQLRGQISLHVLPKLVILMELVSCIKEDTAPQTVNPTQTQIKQTMRVYNMPCLEKSEGSSLGRTWEEGPGPRQGRFLKTYNLSSFKLLEHHVLRTKQQNTSGIPWSRLPSCSAAVPMLLVAPLFHTCHI